MKFEFKFSYEDNKTRSTFLIIEKSSTNVLRRDILGKLKLSWKNIFNSFGASEISSNFDNLTLNKIIPEYKKVFSDELVTLKDFQANIPIDPTYFSARPVPYRLKEKFNTNLNK